MLFLGLIELAIGVTIAVVTVTQIVAPLWRGTKLFPVFRRQGVLESALDQARQAKTESELERELRETQNSIKPETPKS
ncbi:MAG: hypothetical protein IT406_03755 [Candidatus Yanofskybacteria bacterium]|nr:hypothetical protein [Candidatus Yanofskybacteria bacterium]